ncbi:MAG: hypothetical protein ACKON7_11395, partial [Planctomycetaceae bacterium]
PRTTAEGDEREQPPADGEVLHDLDRLVLADLRVDDRPEGGEIDRRGSRTATTPTTRRSRPTSRSCGRWPTRPAAGSR